MALRKLPVRCIKKWDFGIQNGSQTAILDRINTIFGVYVPPMGIHGHAKFGNPSSSRSENFHQKVIPSTDDGPHKHCQRIAHPSGLKSGISAFKMAARRPSWIGSTQFFVYRLALWGYILIQNLAYLPYLIMKISHQNDSVYADGRRMQSEKKR